VGGAVVGGVGVGGEVVYLISELGGVRGLGGSGFLGEHCSWYVSENGMWREFTFNKIN